MSNLQYHSMDEFRAAGFIKEDGEWCDGFQQMICNHVLRLIEVFEGEYHSGTTGPYAIDMFCKLAKFEPLVPLTGEDWEWVKVVDDGGIIVFQNKRCSHVFKQSDRFDGQAYDIDGKVFWSWRETEEFGALTKDFYTNSDCFVPVTFPYTPKREVVFVPTEQFPNEDIK